MTEAGSDQIQQDSTVESKDPSIKDEEVLTPPDDTPPQLPVSALDSEPIQELSKWRATVLLVAMGLSGINTVRSERLGGITLIFCDV
jgi:hypothetical protein